MIALWLGGTGKIGAETAGLFLLGLPALALGILCDGAGQVMGHIAGAGSSEQRLSRYEYRRVDNVTSGDRRTIEALTASLRAGNG